MWFRIILFLVSSLLLLPYGSTGQVSNYSIDFPKFSIPPRPVYIKYLKERRELAYVDYREGLFIPCDSVDERKVEDHPVPLQPFLLSKSWQLIDSLQLVDRGILVYLPREQTVDTWHEMITIQRIDSEGQKSMKLYNSILKSRSKECGEALVSEIKIKGDNYVISQMDFGQCRNFDERTVLSLIVHPKKLIMFQYTLWKVDFISRDRPDQSRVDEVTEFLSGIDLVAGKKLEEVIDN